MLKNYLIFHPFKNTHALKIQPAPFFYGLKMLRALIPGPEKVQLMLQEQALFRKAGEIS